MSKKPFDINKSIQDVPLSTLEAMLTSLTDEDLAMINEMEEHMTKGKRVVMVADGQFKMIGRKSLLKDAVLDIKGYASDIKLYPVEVEFEGKLVASDALEDLSPEYKYVAVFRVVHEANEINYVTKHGTPSELKVGLYEIMTTPCYKNSIPHLVEYSAYNA